MVARDKCQTPLFPESVHEDYRLSLQRPAMPHVRLSLILKARQTVAYRPIPRLRGAKMSKNPISFHLTACPAIDKKRRL